MWVWSCRPGFERDLVAELERTGDASRTGPGRVVSPARPPVWPVFARAGFEHEAEVTLADVPQALAAVIEQRRGPWLLQTWVPDADETNPLSGLAASLHHKVGDRLRAERPDLDARRAANADEALRYGGTLIQACVVGSDRVICGAVLAQETPSLAPGGRARSAAPKDAPSRAARKLVEALSWVGRAPEPGELCVDLGAAPGGWTAVLLQARARVVAVDPASLAPVLRCRRGVRHVKMSAFAFVPEEPVDWLFCDMAWRPLEVAQLLAKWGRRRWSRTLVANLKLPMKQRCAFVQQTTGIIAAAGWRDLRARQLYHDRDEFTLTAWHL